MKFSRLRLLVMLSAAAPACLVAAATDTVSDLQTRFDHETNSVRKAKLLAKLGDEQFAETRLASNDNDYLTAGQVMEKYRDNARAAMDAMKKEHPTAERQMGGYNHCPPRVHRRLCELDDRLVL